MAGADLLLEATQDGQVVFAVGQARALAGRGAKALEGCSLSSLFQEADKPRLEQALERMRQGRRLSAIAFDIVLPDGGRHSIWLSGYRIPEDFDGHLFLALANRPQVLQPPVSPASQRTALPDRDDFARIAQSRLAEAGQAGLTYGLTLLDLPEVKALAQQEGPEAAQAFKHDLAQLLRAHSVGGESVGLLSDTKFGLVHDQALDQNKLKRKIVELAGRSLPEGQAMGVNLATLDLDASGISDEEAAQALVYTINQFSRQEGSAFTVEALSRGVHGQLSATVSEMGLLKSLIGEGRFDLAYQPVVSLGSHVIHHFESLARLRSAEAGEESPFRLVTFAEDTGLIGLLDKAIYERVIDLLHRNFMGDAAVSLAVNLSGHSLADGQFMKSLYGALDAAPPYRGRLLFEMTESSEVRDLAAVNARLQELRKRGHPVCLDDFGAGSAAFHYLRALSVDFVKIDGSYVQHVLKQPKDIPFLKAIAQLCKDLKISMIAEMIEDAGTAELLKSLGVQYGQGYYFGRPDQGLGGPRGEAAPPGFARKDGRLYWTG